MIANKIGCVGSAKTTLGCPHYEMPYTKHLNAWGNLL